MAHGVIVPAVAVRRQTVMFTFRSPSRRTAATCTGHASGVPTPVPVATPWFVALLAVIATGCASAYAGGDVTITGSSTVQPISARVAEQFVESRDAVALSVDGPGTGDGFEIFCSGGADIADASRPIKPEEVQTCADAGIEFIELKVAIDGLSVVTSPRNTQAGCLNFADLYALVGPESTGFDNWLDAQDLAAELGSTTTFPDAPLVVTAPGEESGTYDSFIEIALGDIAEERGTDPVARPDYQASPNDNVIIEGINGSPTSLGWVGFAFVQANADAVKALPIDGGDGCVDPTAETISRGEFPLARPLFIYVNKERARTEPDVAAYVDYYLSDEGLGAVSGVGYVDLPADEITTTRAVWQERRTGTREESD